MPEPSELAVVRIPVTSVWQSPQAPRAVDRPIVDPNASSASWLKGLDDHADEDVSGDGRLGLHGRIETQLVEGEPVRIVERSPDGAWALVRCPWQPSPKSNDGYPGWVPAAHLQRVATERELPPYPEPAVPTDHATTGDHATVALARQHLGLPYLWGGLTPYGFDCSGLVHWAWRTLGTRIPRDAYAQQAALAAIPVDDVRSGDLYFFGRPGRRIHHVGIVVEPGRMVHAPETGAAIVEEDLSAERRSTLVAAARVARTS